MRKEINGPYFLLTKKKEAVNFPLLKTSANVKILGMLAEIELTQIYQNQSEKPIEAVYVFPLGTKTAIHEMKMIIGKKILEANIYEKEKAQEIYDEAKKQGKNTALLRQHRPNVFQMDIANIMPGQKIKIIIKYNEMIKYENGKYEFVFPTVVGPRYISKKINLIGGWYKDISYTSKGVKATYQFYIKIKLKSPIPIDKLSVPTHQVDIKRISKFQTVIELKKEKEYEGNRDFILNYFLKNETIKSGVMLYKGEKENYFLGIIAPPKRNKLNKKEIPKEYIFILDTSGSMAGYPIYTAKYAIEKILRNLSEKDYFNILFFANDSVFLFPRSQNVNRENIQKALKEMENFRGAGGTNILKALNMVFLLPKIKNISKIISIFTDGYVFVEEESFKIIKSKIGKGKMFTFGIGSSVNRYLIEKLARAGKGESFVITDMGYVDEHVNVFLKNSRYPLLSNIKIRFEGLGAYELFPKNIPDIFIEKPIIFLGKYKKAEGYIVIEGNSNGGDYKKIIKINKKLESKKNIALKYLWARYKIIEIKDNIKLDEYSKMRKIIELGSNYNIITDYTSFIIEDNIIRNSGEVKKIIQIAPLPKNIENSAASGILRQTSLSLGFKSNSYKPVIQYEIKDNTNKGELKLFNEIKALIRKKIKFKLAKLFSNFLVSKLTVIFTIKNNKIAEIKVLEFTDLEHIKKQIHQVFEKLLNVKIKSKIPKEKSITVEIERTYSNFKLT